jgi:hypothetical protein
VGAYLFYQTASKEYIDFLAAKGGVDAQTLFSLWNDFKSQPELMAWDSYPIYPYYMPVISR